MARTFRSRADGLFEVETPGVGFMPVHFGADELRSHGFVPYQGATASNDGEESADAVEAASMGGVGNVPDVPREVPGASGGAGPGVAPGAWNPSMGGAPPQSMPNTGAEGAPSDVEAQTPTPPEARAPAEQRAPVRTKPLSAAGAGGQRGAGGMGRPTYSTTKARDQRVGFRIEKGPEIDPDNEAAASDARIDRRMVEQELADKAGERGKRDAKFFQDEVVSPLERQVSAQEIKAQQIRQDFEKRQGEIDAERKAVDKLEVNPRQIWEDEPWAAVLAAMSMIAGGALMARQGRSSNPAADLIQRAMDQNIDVQKHKIATKREGLRDKETELERLTKIMGSPELAEAELRTRQQALVQAWAKKNMMADASDDVQQNLRAHWATEDEALANERRNIDLQFGDRVTEEHRYIPAQTVQVGGRRPLKPDERKRKVQIDGQEGFVVSDAQQRPVQEQIDTLGFLGEQLGEYRRIAADTSLGPEEKKKALASMKRNIGTTASVAQGQGAMAVEEIKGLDETLGQPEDLIGATENDLARIGATQNFYQGKRQRIIQSNVYQDPDATTPFAPPVRSRQVDQ